MQNDIKDEIKLTQFSHGAGCGCKIAPDMLDKILHSNFAVPGNGRLIVGNHSKDDAAVYDMGNGTALISTTDFFMPIVDDPFQFGCIASANAISDVYAMGGTPILAIAILGWPIDKLSPEIAKRVIEGSRSICAEAGIPLAGGHSIDSPEPIFGLAVNGIVNTDEVKRNNTAQENDLLFLTKKIGIGILTTAGKKGVLNKEHEMLAAGQMMQLNKIGEKLCKIKGVHAITDITGFGLLGHLAEMAEGSGLSAEIGFHNIPLLTEDIGYYLDNKAVPGGTGRNWKSYGHKVSIVPTVDADFAKNILADPQTSGGLLIAVDPAAAGTVRSILVAEGLHGFEQPVGRMIKKEDHVIKVLRLI